jgi:hypothetical protein
MPHYVMLQPAYSNGSLARDQTRKLERPLVFVDRHLARFESSDIMFGSHMGILVTQYRSCPSPVVTFF